MAESPVGHDDAASVAVDGPPPPATRISAHTVPAFAGDDPPPPAYYVSEPGTPHGSHGGIGTLRPGAADVPPPPPVIITWTVVDAEPAGLFVPVVVTGTVVNAVGGYSWHVAPQARAEGEKPLAGDVPF